MSEKLDKKTIINTFVAMGFYFSCYALALNISYMGMLLYSAGRVPERSVVILILTLLVWLVLVVLSDEIWWKTFLKMIAYSSGLISIFLGGIALLMLVSYISENKPLVELLYISGMLVASVLLYTISSRVLKLKNL